MMEITRETPITDIFKRGTGKIESLCGHYLERGGVKTLGQLVDIYTNDKHQLLEIQYLGESCLNLITLRLYDICFSSSYQTDESLKRQIINSLDADRREELELKQKKAYEKKYGKAIKVINYIERIYGQIEPSKALEFELRDFAEQINKETAPNLYALCYELSREVERRNFIDGI